jgi:phenylalanyl-tRNA synthetase beta chain
MKVLHSWLKDYLGDSLPSPEKVEELLTFHSFEVESVERVNDETVIDVKILPDRAGDSLSHRGVARELATVLNVELITDPLQDNTKLPETNKLQVKIADPTACRRFTAVLISGVTIKESPEWLQQRLRAIGQRPINNIVDATNYVMYSLGQPMHAYDADSFPQTADGVWQIGVRMAQAGETISLLAEGGKQEDRTVELSEESLLIVDGSTDKPVGLAGIKGGRFAELKVNTTNIILEAASFDSALIRKSAVRHKILTDASKRFENAPSAELPLYAQKMAIKLITEIADGKVTGIVDDYPTKSEVLPVTVSIAQVNSLLGLSLNAEEIVAYLKRTGSEVIEGAQGELIVTPPFERVDLKMIVNFIEEVGRIHGLSAVKSITPTPASLQDVNVKQYYSEKIRQELIGLGFSEVITTSFQKQGNIQLENALASDKSCLRETLVKNISEVSDTNFAHCDLLGLPDVRVFEIGTVFEKTVAGVGEHLALALGVRTKGNGYNVKDDKVLQTGLIAISEVLGEKLDWQIEQGVAEINLSLVLEKLEKPEKYDTLPEKVDVVYKPIIPYPAIARDIALWVDGGSESSVVAEIIKTTAGSLLVRNTLFDTFTKDNRTSYAFRLIFQANDRTLTDVEVNERMEEVYKMMKEQGWEVR